MSNQPQNLTINEISESKQLSAIAITVCRRERFDCLSDILEYYSNNLTFISLSPCGGKTDDELISFCKKYEGCNLEYNENVLNGQILTILEELSDFQRSALERHLEFLLLNLSNRARNILRRFTGALQSDCLLGEILSKGFSMSSFIAARNRTTDEIENFRIEMIRLINNLLILEKEQAVIEFDLTSDSVSVLGIENPDHNKEFTRDDFVDLFKKQLDAGWERIYSDLKAKNITGKLSVSYVVRISKK